MKYPRREALRFMLQAAVLASFGGMTVMGCGGSSGSGGGAAPAGNNTTQTKTTTVLASLEKHAGGAQNIGYEPGSVTVSGSKERINTINSPQGVLTGTGLVYTVNGQAVGNSQAPADATNASARPDTHVVKEGDTIEWFDSVGGSTTRIQYTVAV